MMTLPIRVYDVDHSFLLVVGAEGRLLVVARGEGGRLEACGMPAVRSASIVPIVPMVREG